MGITVLGTGRRYSSLDSYAEEFSIAGHVPRIVLRLSKNQLSSEWENGTEIYNGFLKMPLTDGWAFNIMAGGLAFKSLKKRLAEGIVHYTTFGLPILTKGRDDIVTIHDLFFLDKQDEAYRGFMNISEHFLKRFRDFSNVLTPSFYIKEKLIKYGFSGEITPIYLPAQGGIKFTGSMVESRKRFKLPEDKKLVISISSNLRRKNVNTVIKTMKILGDGYRLVRVGPPLDGAFNFSSLPIADLNTLMNACDVMLFPTLDEGYGKPVVEAFAAGLPVVASRIQVMQEVAGDAAYLVTPVPHECATAVKEVISSKEEYRKMGLERSKLFSREKFAEKVSVYYDKVSR